MSEHLARMAPERVMQTRREYVDVLATVRRNEGWLAEWKSKDGDEAVQMVQMIQADTDALLVKKKLLEDAIPARIHELRRAPQLLAIMIADLAEYLNIGKNMTPAQIDQTAALLCDRYKLLTLEHFAVVFRRVKLGEKTVYDRLDGQVIAQWMAEYEEELRKAAELRAQNDHLANERRQPQPRGTGWQSMGAVTEQMFQHIDARRNPTIQE